MTMSVRLQALRAWLGELEPGVFADLSLEEIADLRESIAQTVGFEPSPNRLGEAVEARSPELAARFRSRSAKDIVDYANLVLGVLQIILGLYQLAGGVLTPTQVTNIFNHIETTVINQTTVLNPPPPAPPTATPSPSEQPPVADPDGPH